MRELGAKCNVRAMENCTLLLEDKDFAIFVHNLHTWRLNRLLDKEPDKEETREVWDKAIKDYHYPTALSSYKFHIPSR